MSTVTALPSVPVIDIRPSQRPSREVAWDWNTTANRVYNVDTWRAIGGTGRMVAGGTYADPRTADQLEWDAIADKAIAGY